MSMIGNLARITETKRQELHQHPEQISGFLYPSSANYSTAAKPGILARLFGAKPPPPPPPPAPGKQQDALSLDDQSDLDKAWHGLHFLFTGSDWEGEFPEGFLVSSGKTIGDEDVGYGPARSFDPDEVAQIAKFLDGWNESDLQKKLDLKKMKQLDIYPSIWDRDPAEDDQWGYLVENFRTMKAFLRETADKKMALLVYLN